LWMSTYGCLARVPSHVAVIEEDFGDQVVFLPGRSPFYSVPARLDHLAKRARFPQWTARDSPMLRSSGKALLYYACSQPFWRVGRPFLSDLPASRDLATLQRVRNSFYSPWQSTGSEGRSPFLVFGQQASGPCRCRPASLVTARDSLVAVIGEDFGDHVVFLPGMSLLFNVSPPRQASPMKRPGEAREQVGHRGRLYFILPESAGWEGRSSFSF